jgi:hypothetical protein
MPWSGWQEPARRCAAGADHRRLCGPVAVGGTGGPPGPGALSAATPPLAAQLLPLQAGSCRPAVRADAALVCGGHGARGAMCNVVLTIAVLDTYTSSFFLSAMSVARHCTVAGALHPGRRGAPWASGVRSLLWVTAVLATTLTALRGGVSICACCASATAAPTDLQKIAVAFVLPLATLGTCWLRRLLQRRRAGWQSRVRPRWRSLARALLVFVVCWLPHQALTLLGGRGRGVDRADRHALGPHILPGSESPSAWRAPTAASTRCCAACCVPTSARACRSCVAGPRTGSTSKLALSAAPQSQCSPIRPELAQAHHSMRAPVAASISTGWGHLGLG